MALIQDLTNGNAVAASAPDSRRDKGLWGRLHHWLVLQKSGESLFERLQHQREDALYDTRYREDARALQKRLSKEFGGSAGPAPNELP